MRALGAREPSSILGAPTNSRIMERKTLITKASADYELLDSGGEEKLERYGGITLVRPDPQALWKKRLPEEEWQKAQGRFARGSGTGEWQTKTDMPKEWGIEFG